MIFKKCTGVFFFDIHLSEFWKNLDYIVYTIGICKQKKKIGLAHLVEISRVTNHSKYRQLRDTYTVADLGGGSGRRPQRPLLSDSTPCRPKGSTLCTILRYPFLAEFITFLKVSPIYTNFEGGARAEKTRFFGQNFQKVPKNSFFGLFFKKFVCDAESLIKLRSLKCFGRAQKINLVDLKKRSTKISNFFETLPPPSRNS